MNRVAQFEKVSWNQFQKDYVDTFGEGKTIDMNDVKEIYDNIKLPCRKTKYSAGHDISIPFDITLASKEKLMIPTGIRCKMNSDHVMIITPRSSLGIKKGLRIANTIPVIDSDYYDADNEGHIFISIINDGRDVIKFKSGDNIVQALFVPYGVADNEYVATKRVGGIGSTTIVEH